MLFARDKVCKNSSTPVSPRVERYTWFPRNPRIGSPNDKLLLKWLLRKTREYSEKLRGALFENGGTSFVGKFPGTIIPCLSYELCSSLWINSAYESRGTRCFSILGNLLDVSILKSRPLARRARKIERDFERNFGVKKVDDRIVRLSKYSSNVSIRESVEAK